MPKTKAKSITSFTCSSTATAVNLEAGERREDVLTAMGLPPKKAGTDWSMRVWVLMKFWTVSE